MLVLHTLCIDRLANYYKVVLKYQAPKDTFEVQILTVCYGKGM